MKKKFLLTGTAVVAGAAILGLASCGTGTEKVTRTKTATIKSTNHYVEAPAAPSYTTDAGRLDVFVNYSSTSGLSRKEGTVNDPISGEQIAPSTLLPTWKRYAEVAKADIKDATDYTDADDAAVWNKLKTQDTMMSQTDNTQAIDLLYNKKANFKGDKFKALDDYINTDNPSAAVMPYFSQYLKDNPSIKKTLMVGGLTNGHIYYTPYFDGVDDIERMLIMDTQITKTVLDNPDNKEWDTATTNGGSNPSANVVQGGFYQPFVDSEFNYAEDQTVPVLFEGKAYNVVIKGKIKNIIKQQNELLASGCTGKQLADQFIAYIKEAYADLFDNGYYQNPSDLFISDSAAYNADELIALLRVVKANPGMISGNSEAEITTFFPRAASGNRIANILHLAQIWGVQGLDGENGGFYIGGDGKVHSKETTKATYDALEYLSQMYDEGLIMHEYWAKGSTDGKVGFLNRYFKKISTDSSYGFMMYDYTAANVAANDLVNGVGTVPSSRQNGFGDTNEDGTYKYSSTGITGILAPLTYWATESNWNHDQDINDKTGKTLIRYYESNRALKDNTWAIPKNADNPEGAARLMDLMFSQWGQIVNNYGPEQYWAKPDTSKGDTLDGTVDANKYYVSDDLTSSGELNPIISTQVRAKLIESTLDFWSYMREYLGATHGVGNVRPMGVNMQATNAYGQLGITNVQDAFTVGNNGVAGDGTVLKLATFSKKVENGNTIYTWNTSVPTGFTESNTDTDHLYGAITGFWKDDKNGNNTGYSAAISRGHTNSIDTITVKDDQGNVVQYSKLSDQFEAFNKNNLFKYAHSIDTNDMYVPAYAK